MLTFLLYVLIAVFVTAAFYRKFFKNLSKWDQEHVPENAFGPAFGIGLFWIIALPSYGVWVVSNKILDKLTKV